MEFNLKQYYVEEARFTNEKTQYAKRKLLINREELKSILTHPSMACVDVDIVTPGESARIIRVLDIVQPIAAADKQVFPGFLGQTATVGKGSTNRIEGFRVVSCGSFPQPQTTSLTTKDGLIDMSGEGAEYSLGSDTINLVLTFQPKPEIDNQEFDNTVRMLTLTVANFLAKKTFGEVPSEEKTYNLKANKGKPTVVYVNQLQDQGPLIRAYLYGRPLGEDFVPTFIHPFEMFDGALVSGNFRNCMKKPTSLHQRDPIMEQLLKDHGGDINFGGVIVSRGHHGDQQLKLRSAAYVSKLAKLVGADGIIVALEGTGNGTIDFQLTLECCEKEGIKTVGVIHELGGAAGDDAPLVYRSSYSDTLISTGGVERAITLGAPAKVVGAQIFYNYMLHERDPYTSFKATPMDCYGSFWKMNMNNFTCVEG